MTRARAAGAPASPYGRRLRDSSARSINTNASGKIHTNNNRRQLGPLQAIAPGPAQAIVFNWKLSKDPLFVEKVRDIVGLYLNPPERALVLCVDEKSQIQALDRSAP